MWLTSEHMSVSKNNQTMYHPRFIFTHKTGILNSDRSSLLRLHTYALCATRAVDADKALLRSLTEIRQI